MFNKKKILATTLGAVFALSALGSAFAAETTPQTQASTQIEKHFGGGKHFGKKGANLEALAAEKGITVDELKAQMEQECEAKLAELAAEKGITVEELKAKIEKNGFDKRGFGGKRGANLEALATEKGITVDELLAQMKQEREAKQQERMEKLAAEKGISVDELKAQMEENREARLAELAKEKGITVDELKVQMEQNGKGFRGLK